MKRTILIIMVAWFCGGCETTETQTAANVTETPAFGAQVQAPFDAMAQNAAQPETVLGSVKFQYDKDFLTPDAKTALDWIAQDIAQRDGLVVVEGHADHFNTDPYNLRLGYKRALNVADYLKSAGVWDERLVIRSFGEARPAATNWIDSERAKNRQVVIKMFDQGDGMTAKEGARAYQKTLQEKKTSDTRSSGINLIMSQGKQ